MKTAIGLLLAIGLIVASAGPVRASRLAPTPPEADRGFTLPPSRVLKEMQEQSLREAVALLEAGKRDEARLRLGAFLQYFPRHAGALELSGVVLMEMKNWGAAEAAFRRALDGDPGRVGALAKLGATLTMQERGAEAEPFFARALAIDPDEPLALLYSGWFAQRRGDVSVALERYDRLRRTQAADGLTQVHALLATLYNETGRPAATVELLRPMLREAKGRAAPHRIFFELLKAELALGRLDAASTTLARLEALLPEGDLELPYARAEVAAAEGDIEKARSILSNAMKADGDRARTLRQLAVLSQRAGDQARAATELEQALEAASAPEDAAASLRDLVAALASRKNTEMALAAAEKALKRFPASPDVGYVVAETRSLAGDQTGALRLLDELVAAHPKAAEPRYLAAVLRIHQGQHARADQDLRAVVAMRPDHIDAWRALAATAHELKGDPAMLAVLKDAVRANPDDPRLLYDVGAQAYSEGRIAEAEAAFRRILAREKDHAPALNDLALLLADEKRALGEARDLAERALALAPRDPVVQDTRAWVLLRSGESEPALKVLQEAAAALPQDGGVHFHLGVAQLQTGAADAGRASLRKALALGLPERYRGEVKRLLDGGRP